MWVSAPQPPENADAQLEPLGHVRRTMPFDIHHTHTLSSTDMCRQHKRRAPAERPGQMIGAPIPLSAKNETTLDHRRWRRISANTHTHTMDANRRGAVSVEPHAWHIYADAAQLCPLGATGHICAIYVSGV